jgi:dihydropteroate synthase-like protein
MPDQQPRVLFVTGQLAEPALRDVVRELAPASGIVAEVAVMKITVAALMKPEWVAKRLDVPDGIDRVILPGYCTGDVRIVEDAAGVPVELGPKDLLDLPEHFGEVSKKTEGYGEYDIEILAEINHAPRLSRDELLESANRMRAHGADLIDFGCVPGEPSDETRDAVMALCDAGHRVSIDTFDTDEVTRAVAAGAELVLSVNSTNVDAAKDWGCEVVAIPDDPGTLGGLDETIEKLSGWNVPFRIDPILEPIGFGFAESLGRYIETRRHYPQAEIMMGVGNLTELTGVDSAGVNVTLIGICQELGIRSILTTEVINWARSSVKEIDLARRLVYHACKKGVLPKHLEEDLILLRDPKLHERGEEALAELASRIRDRNFRIFAERDEIHILNSEGHLRGTDPFDLFEKMKVEDPSHAFYLGYEMAKAVTALTLSKDYRQDQALRWGFLTREEASHLAKKKK